MPKSPAPKGGYRPELDGIRGAAIALVLAEHFHFGPTWAARIGVNLFFVLSGYLITGLLMAEEERTGRVDIRGFYVRRVRRLAPALISMVAVVVVLGLPGNAAVALTYTTNLYLLFVPGDMGVLEHTWTLSLEEQFYVVWPAIFLFTPRRWLMPALAVVLAAAWLLHATVISDGIVAGSLLALTRTRLPAWMGLVGWGTMIAMMATGFDLPVVGLSVMASVVVVGYGGGIRWTPLVRLGTISYGVYLWHYPIAVMLDPLTRSGAAYVPMAAAAIGITLAIVLALVSERVVERPFRVRRSDADQSVGEPTGNVQRTRGARVLVG